jgi:hypothetical protein
MIKENGFVWFGYCLVLSILGKHEQALMWHKETNH